MVGITGDFTMRNTACTISKIADVWTIFKGSEIVSQNEVFLHMMSTGRAVPGVIVVDLQVPEVGPTNDAVGVVENKIYYSYLCSTNTIHKTELPHFQQTRKNLQI